MIENLLKRIMIQGRRVYL